MGHIAGHGIGVDKNGNSYVTGEFIGTVTFGSTQLNSYGNEDIFLTKYDPDGNCLWAKQAGSIYSDVGGYISVDANSNIYITGHFSDTAKF